MLDRLAILGIERIVSYADPNETREGHPDGKHTGLIYRAASFHTVQEAGKTTAVWMLRDFYMDGKVTKKINPKTGKPRRFPIRNLDQYQNFRGKSLEDLPPKIRMDWELAIREIDPRTGNPRAVRWMERATGRYVYVIKTSSYLQPYSVRLRAALQQGAAELRPEDGKILNIKDLQDGMPFFDTPCYEEIELHDVELHPNKQEIKNANKRPVGKPSPGITRLKETSARLAQRKASKNKNRQDGTQPTTTANG